MAQGQGQIQEQKLEQKLQQSISQQQLLQSQLVELPLQQLAERIETEMHDNPALETTSDDPEFTEYPEYNDDAETSDDYDVQREREERSDALDAALESIGRDDEELPVYQGGQDYHEEREEMVYGASQSFYDQLKEQMGVIDLDERQRDIMEYLIGSLDDDGLLRKSLDSISDELAIYHAIDATPQEIESVLHYLQEFDPAGIGGRSLQECLTLQIQRRQPSHLRDLMLKVVQDYFEAFTKKHWKKISKHWGSPTCRLTH
jgi:RNA polymerase sigma-54 factor